MLFGGRGNYEIRQLDADCGCISGPNILEQKQGETHCEIMVHNFLVNTIQDLNAKE